MKRAVLFACIIATAFPCCKKDANQQTDPQTLIELKTLTVEVASNHAATLGGDVSYDGGEPITARGVCWSLNPNPTIKDSSVVTGAGTGIFHVTITNLLSGKRYYVRAFATNRLATVYGNPVTFFTSDVAVKASLRIVQITSVTQTSAVLTANIYNDGENTITERGFCWDSVPNPSLTTANHVAVGSDTGTYNYTLTGLAPYTSYYVTCYAINRGGVAYAGGSLYTLAPTPPTVTTTPLTITGRLVTTGGTITNPAGVLISQRGVVSTTFKQPGVEFKTNDGTGPGTYTSSFTPGLANTMYAVRAYAVYQYKSINQTVYGESIQFVSP